MATLLVEKYETRKAEVPITLESEHISAAQIFGAANEVFESCKSNKGMHAKRAAHAAWRLTPGPARQTFLGLIPQYLGAALCSMTAPKWHAMYFGHASMTKQGLMPIGTPRVLRQAFQRKVCNFYSMNYQQWKLAKSFFAKFLQPVFLQRNAIAEEASFAAALFVSFVSNRR